MNNQPNFPTLALAIFGANLLLCIVLLNEALLWQTIVLAVGLLFSKFAFIFNQSNKAQHLHSNWIKNIGALLLALVILPGLGSLGLLNSMVNLLYSGAVMWWFTANHRQTTWGTQLLVGVTLLSSVSLIYQQSLEYAILVFITLASSIVGLYQVQQFEFQTHGALTQQSIHSLVKPSNIKSKAAYLPPHFFTMTCVCILGSAFLFIVMPSLSPFWKLPQQKITPTGISDSMTPGDIASVAKSSRLAFRAEFNDDKKPPHAELYWRVLTMEDFDGKTWRQHDDRKWLGNTRTKSMSHLIVTTNDSKWPKSEPIKTYSIVAEPNQQQWLYNLGTSTSDESSIYLTADNRLVKNTKVTQRIKYTATQHAKYNENSQTLSLKDSVINKALPSFGLTRTKVLSNRLWQQANQDAEEYNRLILAYLANSGFRYSLSPPTLSGDHIDNFLFDVKVGFCAHFASVHSVLLRLQNIPARIVTGYHGGEYNPNGNYFNIYDSSAHAWVEFSPDNKRWLQTDPTAVISPLRISEGLEQALTNNNETVTSNLNIVKQTPWLNAVRQHLQSLDYYWTVFVLDFDQQKRENLISSFFANLSWIKVIITFGVIMITLVSGFLIFKIKNKPKLTTSQRLLKRLYVRLQNQEKQVNPKLSTHKGGLKNHESHNFTLTQHQNFLTKAYPNQQENIADILKDLSVLLYSKNSSLSYKDVCNKIDLI